MNVVDLKMSTDTSKRQKGVVIKYTHRWKDSVSDFPNPFQV